MKSVYGKTVLTVIVLPIIVYVLLKHCLHNFIRVNDAHAPLFTSLERAEVGCQAVGVRCDTVNDVHGRRRPRVASLGFVCRSDAEVW